MVEHAIDLQLWQETPLSELWDESVGANRSGKQRLAAMMEDLQAKITAIRRSEIDYTTFEPLQSAPVKEVEVLSDSSAITLVGRCPCPASGERNRCCNLVTLDTIQQCPFGCAYCSIQSFYQGEKVQIFGDLEERLTELKLDSSIWHIGTGQSSDSLLYGDQYGTLSALDSFARRHPQVVIELKTKSSRSDWIQQLSLPTNIIPTWSLNAPTIIEKEESLTPSLEERLATARLAADNQMLVGFHLHPLIRFKGWQDEYQQVVEAITSLFSPSEVLMISLGTLTFTKATLRQARLSLQSSRTTCMELTEMFGKFSYPREIRLALYQNAYHAFPRTWREKGGPFFYLCLEEPEMWEPLFGYEYPNNAVFEEAMKAHYLEKIATYI